MIGARQKINKSLAATQGMQNPLVCISDKTAPSDGVDCCYCLSDKGCAVQDNNVGHMQSRSKEILIVEIFILY